jgi:hypothetical protein
MKSTLALLASIEGLTIIEGIASDIRQTRATIISNDGFGVAWATSFDHTF